MQGTNRLIWAVLAMVAGIVLASGVAIAATINGTEGPDRLNGTENPDVINGYGGTDTIQGFKGGDTIDGGEGDDQINGNRGADDISGDDGIDIVNGDEGADDIDGGEGDDQISGSAGTDDIRGGDGADTIDGGAEDDTLSAGPRDEVAPDTIYGKDGNDKIDTVNYPLASADAIDCGYGNDDEATADTSDTVPDPQSALAAARCENVLTIEERSEEQRGRDDRIEGYFDDTSEVHVEFEAYEDREEEGPLGILVPEDSHPYNRATTSIITLDDDRLPNDEDRIQIKLTVNPEEKVLRQRVTTPEEGAEKKLSDEDKEALKQVDKMLARFLDREGADDCNLKNQETLVLRHLSYLTKVDGDHELKDFERTYREPEQRCGSNAGSNTNASTRGTPSVGSTNVLTKAILPVGAKRCPANADEGIRHAEARFASFSGSTKPTAVTYGRYVPLQSAAGDAITLLPCDSSSETAYYTDAFGAPYTETGYGPASGDLTGTCGDLAVGPIFAYTQDCLDHDICARRLGDQAGDDCGDELFAALDDFALGAVNIGRFPEGSPGYCDPNPSTVSRSPGARSPGSSTVGGQGALKQA